MVLATALFRVLTARRLTTRELWPGALIAGSSAYLLTLLGGLYVDRVVGRASAIYGSFATVIGLLAWISLLVQSFVIANLVNVVRVEQLWPRTMTGRDFGDGDIRAVRLTTRREAIVSDARLAEARSGGYAEEHSSAEPQDRSGEIGPFDPPDRAEGPGGNEIGHPYGGSVPPRAGPPTSA